MKKLVVRIENIKSMLGTGLQMEPLIVMKGWNGWHLPVWGNET